MVKATLNLIGTGIKAYAYSQVAMFAAGFVLVLAGVPAAAAVPLIGLAGTVAFVAALSK